MAFKIKINGVRQRVDNDSPLLCYDTEKVATVSSFQDQRDLRRIVSRAHRSRPSGLTRCSQNSVVSFARRAALGIEAIRNRQRQCRQDGYQRATTGPCRLGRLLS
jgi:hypothetical protein